MKLLVDHGPETVINIQEDIEIGILCQKTLYQRRDLKTADQRSDGNAQLSLWLFAELRCELISDFEIVKNWCDLVQIETPQVSQNELTG